ncbi:hypothetical protein B4064_0352 [Caldibacillus thermoamylovorans]|nr:hypothetical protein B4064_0352 [Caldibacillus thermoamylovorans]
MIQIKAVPKYTRQSLKVMGWFVTVVGLSGQPLLHFINN